MRRLATALVLVSTGLVTAGCGIANPYARQPNHPSTRTRTAQPPSPSVRSRPERIDAALRRYTLLSIDWTSRSLADQQRELARLATAGARAQALQTAVSYGAASTLQHSRVANRGRITSIAAGQGPRRGWWLITTQEQTTGSGAYARQPAQTHVYAARLTQTPTGWKVSTWSPQS